MKKGFSLIEIVFAIVVIAISLMSVPMLLKQSSKSDEYSIIQEAVLATSTKMGNILSLPWDGASFDNTNKILRVLDVSGGDSELARDPMSLNSNYRKGNVIGNKRRRFFDTNTMPLDVGGISQFNGDVSTIQGASGAYDYKDTNIKMTTSVFYISDSADYNKSNITFTVNPTPLSGTQTNIKMIQIVTTLPSLNQTLTLRTFSCNIGQTNFLHRNCP